MTARSRAVAGVAALALGLAGIASAHVTIRPNTSQAGATEAPILDMLHAYDAAFNAKDLDALGRFYDPAVTIFEGGGINNGWADYRDHHLGPELQAFTNLQFGHRNSQVRMLGTDAALVTSEYFLKARLKAEDIDATGLETLLLSRQPDGRWMIRHSHTSSRRRPAPPK